MEFGDIPEPFRRLHTDLVTDTDRVLEALAEMGVQLKGSTKYNRMTKEEVFSALSQLDASLPSAVEALLRECQDGGFRIVVNRSIMIKSAIPGFGEVNFGTLLPDGRLQTNYISESSERLGDDTVAADYLNGIAALINQATVRRDGKPWTWRVEVFGALPKISDIITRSCEWVELMKVARRRFSEAAFSAPAAHPKIAVR